MRRAGLRAVAAVVVVLAGCADADDGTLPDTADPTDGTTAPAADDRVPGRWQLLDDVTAPTALTEVGSAVFEGRIWTAGGLTATGVAVDTTMAFDPATRTWSDGPPLPDRLHHVAMVGGDHLYVIGGYQGDFGTGGPQQQVWVLDDAQEAWLPGPELPEPRAAGAAAWDGSRVVYAGGIGPGDVSGTVFALEDGTWRRLGVELSVAREHLSAASDGEGRVWFLAGRDVVEIHRVVDLVVGDTVSRIGELPSTTSGAGGFHHPTFGACVAGGESFTDTINRAECIDHDGNVVRLPPLARARHGLAAGVVDGTAWVLLGGPTAGLSVSDTAQMLELD